MSAAFDRKIHETVSNPQLQLTIYTATGRLVDKRKGSVTSDLLPEYQDLRTQASTVKKHTIENLDYYLEQFERQVDKHGGKVVYCKDGDEVADFVLGLAKERGARLIVKSKSMTTEEIDFNERLEHLGVENETVIEKQAGIARAVLREKFLAADIGVSGANFLVADSGAVVLVENEGNARLTTTAPRIHIAVAGIEKLIPRA